MHQLKQCLLLSSLIFGLSLGMASMAFGQFSLPSSNSSSDLLPSGVARYGNIEVTTVQSQLTGKTLFEIASTTVFDRNQPGDKVAVEVRADQITAAIDRAVFHFSQTEDELTVAIRELNRVFILQANSKSRQIQLATVTDLDAYYYGQSQVAVARQWQQILQKELTEEVRLMTPDVLLERVLEACKQLFIILTISLVIWLIQRSLRRKWQALKTEQKLQQTGAKVELEATDTANLHEDTLAQLRSQFLLTLHSFVSLKYRLWLYSSLRWLLFWAQIILWYIELWLITNKIPFLMRYQGWLLGTPIQLLLIWFLTGLAIRISDRVIDHFSKNWSNSPFFLTLGLGDSQRRLLRSATITSAIEGLITFVISLAGFVAILNVIGIPTGSVLAGGAILGLAISFGSQSLIKDLVNGCLILAEDQFAVGDVIRVNQLQGLVENLNLRVTQLRSPEGKLITIPNSAIAAVENLTRSWSRVDFSVEVAYDANLKQALALLGQVAQQLYADPAWRPKILEPPEILGVDQLAHTGMALRVWIKTAPLEQWRVGREYRYRVRLAFEEQGIEIGTPQVINHVPPS